MKKNKESKRRLGPSKFLTSRIKTKRQYYSLYGVLFVLATVSIGYAVYKMTFAAATAGIVSFKAVDVRTGNPASGIDIRIRATSDNRYCSSASAVTDGSGTAWFQNCQLVGTTDYYYVYYVGVPAGWTVESAVGDKTQAMTFTAGGAFGPYTVAVRSPAPAPAPPPPAPAPAPAPAPTPSGCGAGTLNDKCFVIVNPFKASPSSVAYNGTSTLSWKMANANGCRIDGYVGGTGGEGSWVTPKLTKTTTFNLYCSSFYGSPIEQKATVNVAAAPTPPASSPNPPSTPPTSSPRPAPTGGTSKTSTSTKVSSTAKAAPAGASDTQSPSAPSNLTATAQGSNVDLAWTESTDNVGVTGYTIERSTDESTWETLKSGHASTVFTDNDTDFSKKYFYRVSAQDAAGNSSDSAVVEISTVSFEPNYDPESELELKTEDGSIVIKIPAGALSEKAVCELADSEETAPENMKPTAGPFVVSCKLANSNAVTNFEKPVRYEFTGSKISLYLHDGDGWKEEKGQTSNDAPNLVYESTDVKPFMLLAAKSGTPWALLGGIGALLLLIIGGFVWWRRRSGGDSGYVGSGYQASTLYGNSTGGAPIPAGPSSSIMPTPAPTPTSSQAPGAHQIEVPSTPVTNPALAHHSPLDRLNDMEQAETSGQAQGGNAKPQETPELHAPGDPNAPGAVHPKDPNQ